MAKAAKRTAVIEEKVVLAEGIISMWLKQEEITKNAKAGQFVSVYCNDKSRILPRPISLCEIDKENGRIRLVYRIAGEGTKELSEMNVGENVEIMEP